MASRSQPITLARFAAALKELPSSSLFAKVAEIRNSMAHLSHSNAELKDFAESGDQACADAIAENEEVVERMRWRLMLLKGEIEGRGLEWNEPMTTDVDGNFDSTQTEDGFQSNGNSTRPAYMADRDQDAQQAYTNGTLSQNNLGITGDESRSGRQRDADSTHLMAGRLQQDNESSTDGENGLHL